ncbi:MAG TPA: hypothetical protein VIQ27_14870 [Gemmatimonadales bacterium]|jgi:hypothetical protein
MVLKTIGLLLLAALGMWGLIKWIAATPWLMTDVKACRGDWAEARLRGCEQGIGFTGIPVEPLNTFSNLAYLAAGWILFQRQGTPATLVLALAMTILWVGSSIYHGTKTMWGARLDHAGMYSVFGVLAVYCLAPDHAAIHNVMIGAGLAMGIGFSFIVPGDLNSRMGLLLGLMSLRAFLLGTPLVAGISLGLFAVAFVSWLLDKRTTVLSRFGHAIWHAFTAAAITTMFSALTR